jgi:hypothetical protein
VKHFINDDSDRKNLRVNGEFEIFEGLRSHVKRRAGIDFIEILVVKADSKAKISDDRFALFEENILGFKVSVDDVLGVQRGEAIDDGFDDDEGLLLCEFFALFGEFVEIASLTKLSDDEVLIGILLGL